MKPQEKNLTTEYTEKRNLRYNNSEFSVVKFSQKEFPLSDVTEKIISCAIEVHSTLGSGLLESLYEEALVEDLH